MNDHPAQAPPTAPLTLQWCGGVDGALRLIDQTLLPGELRYVECTTAEDVWEAIHTLRVRGAPAIGVAAAYGVVLGTRLLAAADRTQFDQNLESVCKFLATSRPTAVNLFWALERMRQTAATWAGLASQQLCERLLQEARAIEAEDRAMCAAIGRHGADLLADRQCVLTHCNAGALATAGEGTALAVIFEAVRQGKRLRVFADETRPLLQGARLTAWELMQRAIPVTLICDAVAGWAMRQGMVDAVLTGADRIAANGDVANKIGTYAVAVLARRHGIPFYVAAPSSTFHLALPSGEAIPIEQRSADEVTRGFCRPIAPESVGVYNPAFDVTPAELIDAIVTERGVIRPVTAARIREVLTA